MPVKLIYVTVPNRSEALQLAETVLGERLAACANISGEITSLFHWNGALCRKSEVLLLLKTTGEKAAPLTARIRELHSYECPCIAVLPVEGGHSPFLEWVAAETTAQAGNNGA